LSCSPRLFDQTPGRRGSIGRFRLRVAVAAGWLAAIVVVAPAAADAAAGCEDCGAVRGTVAVEQATVRTDGPKRDLDVVVVLDPVGDEVPPPPSEKAEMDQRGLVFIPHVLAVQRGTTVTFLNNDNDQHNVYFLNDQTGETLDIGTWGQGVAIDHTFDEEGTIITLCKLHLEMAAYIVVVDSPWFVQSMLDSSSTRAEFVIEGVPPGEYELTVWHKKLKQKGGPTRITVNRGGTTQVDAVITKAKLAGRPG
jgi:plastocyanin